MFGPMGQIQRTSQVGTGYNPPPPRQQRTLVGRRPEGCRSKDLMCRASPPFFLNACVQECLTDTHEVHRADEQLCDHPFGRRQNRAEKTVRIHHLTALLTFASSTTSSTASHTLLLWVTTITHAPPSWAQRLRIPMIEASVPSS